MTVGASSRQDPGLPLVADAERAAWVTLASADGIGPTTFARLVAAFGTAASVLEAARRGDLTAAFEQREDAARGGRRRLPPGLGDAIAAAAATAGEELDRVEERGDAVVLLPDPAYPERLRGLEDAPPLLFVRGSVEALSAPRAIAVVGTRRPTPAGRSFAAAAGAAIASAGASVVSGLAFGIDAAAHAAAVEVDGITVGLIGSGLDVITPVAHRRLAASIVEAGGAIVSELASGIVPTNGTYPRRNRLIAGISEAVVVVEAPRRSGALNTAHWAATFGRDLYVVPGRPWEATTAGCVALLHDVPGTHPVVDVPTLLGDLGLVGALDDPALAAHPALEAVVAELSPVEAALARELRRAPASVDGLARACLLPADEAAMGLSLLELRGYAWSSGPLYLAGGALRDAR